MGDSQHDYILLDRSGSMASRWSDALGGVNAYVRGLAKDPETKGVLVTVAVFDSAGPFEVLRKNLAASAWRDIDDNEASPRGMTPLYDAVGRLVTMAEIDAPKKSALVVMTDGHENASIEHNRESAKALLDRCRKRGWQVIFLGADFDNSAQGEELGNDVGRTMPVAAPAMPAAMAETARMRASYASSGAPMEYSPAARAAAAPPSPPPAAPSPMPAAPSPMPAAPSLMPAAPPPPKAKSRGFFGVR